MPVSIAPKKWTVLGMFPNPSDSSGRRSGLHTDYLEELGGESAAVLLRRASVKDAIAREVSTSNGTINLVEAFPKDNEAKVAYAYAEWTVRSARSVKALFGSDDGAKVWLNGKLVHTVDLVGGRSLAPGQDVFDVDLMAGKNRILVKVENSSGGWGFSLQILDKEGLRRKKALEVRTRLESADPGPERGPFIVDTAFPAIVWRQKERADIVFGRNPLQVEWYGPDLKPATQPTVPGRYTALIKCKTRDGFEHRRMLTFAKLTPDMLPEVYWPPYTTIPRTEIDAPSTWKEPVRNDLPLHAWRALAEYHHTNENAAVLYSAQFDADKWGKDPAPLRNSFIAAAEHQLALRMHLEGRTPKPMGLPALADAPGREIAPGTEHDAGLKPGTVEKLREICRMWIQDDPNGFTVLVVRRGVICMEEGFGGFEASTPFYPASIGKSIGGLLMAQAADQGLIAFDQPLSDILPMYARPGADTITFRMCFTHLTGLKDHASHAGLFNAYLDHAFLTEELVFEKPGIQHRYSGDGNNLAGKALELITGQSVVRMLYQHLQAPFEEPVTQYDLGFGTRFTARYLGKVGQMLLNKGVYGKRRFLRPETVEAVLPKRLADFFPNFTDKEMEWGIGFTWMPDSLGPGKPPILGPKVFGHGAASASVWRVSPEHELVVVIGRNAFKDGGMVGEWTARFLAVLKEGL